MGMDGNKHCRREGKNINMLPSLQLIFRQFHFCPVFYCYLWRPRNPLYLPPTALLGMLPAELLRKDFAIRKRTLELILAPFGKRFRIRNHMKRSLLFPCYSFTSHFVVGLILCRTISSAPLQCRTFCACREIWSSDAFGKLTSLRLTLFRNLY